MLLRTKLRCNYPDCNFLANSAQDLHAHHEGHRNEGKQKCSVCLRWYTRLSSHYKTEFHRWNTQLYQEKEHQPPLTLEDTPPKYV
jgi:hypothetical protein